MMARIAVPFSLTVMILVIMMGVLLVENYVTKQRLDNDEYRLQMFENRLDDLEQDSTSPDNTEHTRIEPFERRA